MGQFLSQQNHDDSEETSFHQPLPEVVVLSRKTFQSHLKNRSFDSWEDLIEALPNGETPQGSSETIVKFDPVDVCSWAGIVCSAAYGVGLWLCVHQLPRDIAGKLWPNLPVAVGATGTLCLLSLQHEPSTLGVLLCCIVPATAATLFWMRKLPEDPDRATLVTNLFLEIWAFTIALRMLVTGEESLPSASYFDFASLTIIGSGLLVVAVMLYRFPGVWGSVELVTWTLNMGVIGVEAGTAGSRIPFFVMNALCGLLGFKLQRSFPLLTSALALAAVSIRLSIFVSDSTGSSVAGAPTWL
eukprot:Skav214846  [mRNA]  locus=scaffold16:130627:132446:+ [translate_table: standard]